MHTTQRRHDLDQSRAEYKHIDMCAPSLKWCSAWPQPKLWDAKEKQGSKVGKCI